MTYLETHDLVERFVVAQARRDVFLDVCEPRGGGESMEDRDAGQIQDDWWDDGRF